MTKDFEDIAIFPEDRANDADANASEETAKSSSDDDKTPQDQIDDFFKPDELLKLAQKNGNLHEAIREIVFKSAKDDFGTVEEEEEAVNEKQITKKREEIHDILDNLDTELQNKSTKEVAAVFTSLMDIQSQLSIQKTDGVITVRTLLKHFFNLDTDVEFVKKFRYQEITLIFTPEEVQSVRRKLEKIDDSHPLFAFFTSIVDQACDVVQYNEMSGRLLIEITKYFLGKLDSEGYGETSQTIDFKERHERSKGSFERVMRDFQEDEQTINKHLENYPVLVELPRYLRLLIYIKLGVTKSNKLKQILQLTKNSIGKYARARGAVQLDFKRFFSQQQNVLRRQRIILKLHQDILQYTGQVFEEEFAGFMKEMESMLSELEASLETLDPGSPEYEELLKKKAAATRKIEARRRKLDVVKSQERLIDVQHQMISNALSRFDENEALNSRIQEQLEKTKNKPIETNTPAPKKKKALNRMVMSRSRD